MRTAHHVRRRLSAAFQAQVPHRWQLAFVRSHHGLSLVVAISLAFSVVASVRAAHVIRHLSARSSPSPTAAGRTPRYLVLMVLDGGRPDYFGLTKLPHVDALRKRGTQYTRAVDGILEAETPAGHATIATGSPPAQDGILGFDWANDSGRYSLFSPSKMGALEQIMTQERVPTIASLFKARHPRAKVVALSGHKYYAAAPLGGPAADVIMYYQGDSKGRYVPVGLPGHEPPPSVLHAPGVTYPTIHLKDGVEDTLVTKLALATFAKLHQQITLINYPEFDWPLGHVDGSILDRAKVITDMKGFDHDLSMIERAYRKAGILDKTLFVITADHGMMPITHFVPSSVISNAIAQAGTTAPDIAYNSGVYVWLADATKAPRVAQNVMAAHEPGIQSTYYLSNQGHPHYVPAVGSARNALNAANRALLRAMIDGHEPSVVVFGKRGVSFSNPSTHWKADHGGNQWQSQHIPLILAGPGIRRGRVIRRPTRLWDVAPTVLSVMGVRPHGMKGSVLTGALRRATVVQRKARQAEMKRIALMVNTLQAVSKH